MATAARAAALAGALDHSRALTDELCAILGNFDQRMGRLEEAILPVQARRGFVRALCRFHLTEPFSCVPRAGARRRAEPRG